MMHAKEEVITLLDGQQLAPVLTPSQARRKKALKVLLGVVGAVVLVTGSVVAVEMVGAKSDGSAAGPVGTMTMSTQSGSEPAPSSLTADFGWSTINNGWCTARAVAQCLFSSDKDQCKKEIHASCDSKPAEDEPSDDDEEEDDDDDDGEGGSGSRVSGSRASGSQAGSQAFVGSNHTAAKNQTMAKTHRNHTKSSRRSRTPREPSAGDSAKPTPLPTQK